MSTQPVLEVDRADGWPWPACSCNPPTGCRRTVVGVVRRAPSDEHHASPSSVLGRADPCRKSLQSVGALRRKDGATHTLWSDTLCSVQAEAPLGIETARGPGGSSAPLGHLARAGPLEAGTFPARDLSHHRLRGSLPSRVTARAELVLDLSAPRLTWRTSVRSEHHVQRLEAGGHHRLRAYSSAKNARGAGCRSRSHVRRPDKPSIGSVLPYSATSAGGQDVGDRAGRQRGSTGRLKLRMPSAAGPADPPARWAASCLEADGGNTLRAPRARAPA